MRRKHLFLYSLITTCIIVIGLGYRVIWGAEKESNDELGIPPEVVADYVHAVIEADRTSYTKHVERLQDRPRRTGRSGRRHSGRSWFPRCAGRSR